MNRYTRKLSLASAISLAIMTSANSLAAPEPSGEIKEARQESQILTTYALSRHLDTHDLKVTVDDGVATLTGKVSEEVSKELAKQIALGVNGINDVDNQIEVDADYTPTTSSGERSYGEVVQDASITAAVKSKLLWSKDAPGLSVNVETTSGKVTLLGSASSQGAKEMAGMLASNTYGVEAVDNKLAVDETEKAVMADAKEETASLGQRISDSWITTKVKSSLMYSNIVHSSDISVTTRDGVVSLNGKVASGAEHALAVELTKNVQGVTRVDAKALSHS